MARNSITWRECFQDVNRRREIGAREHDAHIRADEQDTGLWEDPAVSVDVFGDVFRCRSNPGAEDYEVRRGSG